MTAFFDHLELWEIFVGTLGLTFLCIEFGLRLGRRHRSEDLKLGPAVNAMATSTAGLLAFMLAMTFGAAVTRHETRKQLVIREANAISTTYLRTAFIPEPTRSITRQLLREYVECRVSTAQKTFTLPQGREQSEILQTKLWEQAAIAGNKNPGWITTGLFIQSLNEVIDLHLERLTFALRFRLPWTSWMVLYLLATLTMFLMGYRIGLEADRTFVGTVALVLSFSVVLLLIADLDRPQRGLIRVSQAGLIDLQKRLNSDNSDHKQNPADAVPGKRAP